MDNERPGHPETTAADPGKSEGARQYPCAQCGAKLVFQPGTDSLRCEYCGHANTIGGGPARSRPAEGGDEDGGGGGGGGEGGGEPGEPSEPVVVEEIGLLATLESLSAQQDRDDAIVCHCESCGADVTMRANVTSQACAFCGTPVVAQGLSRKLVRPRALLPFGVTKERATDAFSTWLGGLWFAPGDLKQMAAVDGRLMGVYLPYWTFDAKAETDYTGRRGDDYWDTETYWSTVNGKRTMRTRRVRKTRWRSVAGRVRDQFDDVLVPASTSLPSERLAGLGTWDVKALKPYDSAYLSGFETESYTVDLKAGFEAGRQIMIAGIRGTICRDIGGDHQRISTMHPRFHDLTFKHILVPVWIAAYRYRGKAYRFVINGRTGAVSGDRPWSAGKIALAIGLGLLAVAVVVAVIAMANR